VTAAFHGCRSAVEADLVRVDGWFYCRSSRRETGTASHATPLDNRLGTMQGSSIPSDVSDPHLKAVLAAADEDEHEAALREALVVHGVDLYVELAEIDEPRAHRALHVLLLWLDGSSITSRADEPERRVRAAKDALDLFDDLCGCPHKSAYADPRVMPSAG
jgi:hypothetical protein